MRRSRWTCTRLKVGNNKYMSENIPEFSLLKRELPESEKNLAEDIRERGFGDSEVMERIQAWMQEQEQWAEGMGISRANIEVMLRKGELLEAAGYYEDAWGEMGIVRECAKQEGAHDLFASAEALMDKMDNEMGGKE